MEKFIEITTVDGKKQLINIRHIVSVSIWDRGYGLELITQIQTIDGHYPKTYESYEEVVKKIQACESVTTVRNNY